MRRFLLALLVVLGLSPFIQAQGYRFDSVVINGSSPLTPVPNATVTVCSGAVLTNPCSSTGSLAAIYTDAALTIPFANPCVGGVSPSCVDTQGNFGFYIAPSNTYTISISGPGLVAYNLTVTAPALVSGGGGGGGPINPQGPRPWIDVTNPAFAGGADPTGVSDSTAAINAAMLFACPGATANPAYPAQNCGYDIFFPPTGPPNYAYKVTQPQAPSNAPALPYIGSGMHLIGGNSGNQFGASPSPPEVPIVATCGVSPGKGPVFQVGIFWGNNVSLQNLYISGCNEAVNISGGSFYFFNNVSLTAQNQHAGGTYGQGTGPFYNSPLVATDVLNIQYNGGAIFSNGNTYPATVMVGDDCTTSGFGPGCVNIVGLAYFSNLLMAGGNTLYLQTGDLGGSPAGHIGFTNIDYESNLGPAFVFANLFNAYTSLTALNFTEVVDSDQTITPGNTIDPLVQFNLTPPGGGRTNGISGLTINHSQGSGYAVEVLNGTSLDNYVANGCQTGCDTTALDASGNSIGVGTVTGQGGVDTVSDVSTNTHLQTSQRTIGGNQFGISGGYRGTRKGSKFASYGIDAANGFMFGDANLPGWYAELGSPLNSTYPNEVDMNWATTYPPTSVAATPSNSGGTLAAGTYYIYMVSTTGATCGGADTQYMSAPSAIAGPYTITGSTGSLAVTWTAPALGPGTVSGYCVLASAGNYNSGSIASNLVTGTSSTVTSFPNAPSALPIYNQYSTTYSYFPTTAILASISLPFATSTPPWTPTCIGAGRCGAYLEPSLLATDNFQRPNNVSGVGNAGGLGLVGGSVNWGPVVSTVGYAVMNVKDHAAFSNQYLAGGPGLQPYIALNPLGDQFVLATIGNFVNGASDYIAISAREAGDRVDTEYIFQCYNGSSIIAKRIAGTQTSLATGGAACANGNVIELDVVSTKLFAYINGSQVLTATDSSIASGYTGMGIGGQLDSVTSWTGGSMTLGRGAQSIYSQQNLWYGEQDFSGAVFKLIPAAFSTLPACNAAHEGFLAAVNDSTASTFGSTITGSGSNHVKAYCNATNWIVN